MAAALRQATRRIGTQAAAAEAAAAQRLFAELQALPIEEKKKKEAAIRLLLIQLRKQELYDLLDKSTSECTVKGTLGRHNTRLLHQLSLQVRPRHDDPRWRSARRWGIAGDCFKYAGGFYIGKTVGDGLVHVFQESAGSAS